MAGIVALLEGVANVMETVTFIQFIEEEAIQSAALGIFLAIRGKSLVGAMKGMTLLRGQLLPNLRYINNNAGWLAPYSKGPFQDFCDATETNLDIYEDLLFARKK